MEIDCKELLGDGWKTPDTYAKHYAPIPNKTGVYLILGRSHKDDSQKDIVMYAGMSTNLAQRHTRHPVTFEIQESGYFAFTFFKESAPQETRKLELELIQKYNPPFNIIGKRRAI